MGALPKGPVQTVSTPRGTAIALALPHGKPGRVWRLARTVDARIVRQQGEGDIGGFVVITFRAVGAGDTTIVFAETKGETPKAYRALRYRVHVS